MAAASHTSLSQCRLLQPHPGNLFVPGKYGVIRFGFLASPAEKKQYFEPHLMYM